MPPGRSSAEERARVEVDLALADVLGHADARDRVERARRQLAVVGDADLDPVGQAGGGDALARQLRLRLGQRDAEHAHAVLARRVDREAPPAAADVEDPLPGCSSSLLATRSSLVRCASSSVCAPREKIAQL